MSILSELYYGNICPMEKHIKVDGEYKKLLTKATDLMEKLNESLSEEDKSIWNEINDMSSIMESISERESFIEGFCLGARTILEIMNYDSAKRKLL